MTFVFLLYPFSFCGLIILFFLFFPHFGCPKAYGARGPGIRSEPSLELSHSCCNNECLTHCAGPGIEPVSQHSQDAANPILPLRSSDNFVLRCFLLFLVFVNLSYVFDFWSPSFTSMSTSSYIYLL